MFFSTGGSQGGILSPLLFNLYINDLSIGLLSINAGCYVNDSCCNHFIYADDTVLLAPSPSALQKLINFCESYAVDNEITFNVKKSKYMCCKPSSLKDIVVPNVNLNNLPLDPVHKEKYLGAIIESSCKDDEDIARQIRGVYARGNMLISKFKSCNSDIKIRLFKTYVSSLYGCALLCNFKSNSMQKLKVAYNNVFRKFMSIDRKDSISANMIILGVDTLSTVTRKYIVSFINRLTAGHNSILSALLGDQFLWSRFLCFWIKEAF